MILGQLVDEDLFRGVDGLVLAAECGAEMVELGDAFIGEDELFGMEAVPEGIL